MLAHFVFGWVLSTTAAPFRRLESFQERKRREAEHRRAEEGCSTQKAHSEQQRREAAWSAAGALRRRKDARAAALRVFSLYTPKIGDRFSLAMFDEYAREFMSDDSPPEDVERRGEELLDVFEQHAQQLVSRNSERTLDDLAHWFLDQKDRIEGLPVDDKVKRRHRAQLNARYAELTSELLEELKP